MLPACPIHQYHPTCSALYIDTNSAAPCLLCNIHFTKLYFYRTQVYLGSDLWVRVSLTGREVCADLTDVTLADEDTNSILADNAKRAIQGIEAMQVM